MRYESCYGDCKMKKLIILMTLLLMVQSVFGLIITENVTINSTVANITINVTFNLTLDQLTVEENYTEFHNLTYNAPSGWNGSYFITLYNITQDTNNTYMTSHGFPMVDNSYSSITLRKFSCNSTGDVTISKFNFSSVYDCNAYSYDINYYSKLGSNNQSSMAYTCTNGQITISDIVVDCPSNSTEYNYLQVIEASNKQSGSGATTYAPSPINCELKATNDKTCYTKIGDLCLEGCQSGEVCSSDYLCIPEEEAQMIEEEKPFSLFDLFDSILGVSDDSPKKYIWNVFDKEDSVEDEDVAVSEDDSKSTGVGGIIEGILSFFGNIIASIIDAIVGVFS